MSGKLSFTNDNILTFTMSLHSVYTPGFITIIVMLEYNRKLKVEITKL